MNGPASEVTADSKPPDLPGIELLRRIGSGGFGEVWLGRNRTTGLLRAVKLIARSRGGGNAAGRELVSLVLLEAHLQTRHPNLLTVHHVGESGSWLFYLMDPADDQSGAPASADESYQPATLQALLARGPLSPDDCLRYGRQLLAGLSCLHTAGMVHRDVKPSNCLFVGGQLQLADFGLLTESSRPLSLVGTRSYMPPDGRMDFRADVYAAGLVLYEMYTGLPADCFPELGARAAEIVQDRCLASLNRLVLHACAGDAEKRFADARPMQAAVDAIRSGKAARPWGRRVSIAALVGILGVAAASVVAWNRVPPGPVEVNVNFITEPYEASILLDGELLRQPDGQPYTTPCTVMGLKAGRHKVIFRRPNAPDIERELDLTTARQVTARWTAAR